MGVPVSACGGPSTRPPVLLFALLARLPIATLAAARALSRLPLRILGPVLILALSLSGVCAQEIRYLYDDLGRLVGVVDQQGNAAEYVYDAVPTTPPATGPLWAARSPGPSCRTPCPVPPTTPPTSSWRSAPRA